MNHDLVPVLDQGLLGHRVDNDLVFRQALQDHHMDHVQAPVSIPDRRDDEDRHVDHDAVEAEHNGDEVAEVAVRGGDNSEVVEVQRTQEKNTPQAPVHIPRLYW